LKSGADPKLKNLAGETALTIGKISIKYHLKIFKKITFLKAYTSDAHKIYNILLKSYSDPLLTPFPTTTIITTTIHHGNKCLPRV
jgi:hypothetical protein